MERKVFPCYSQGKIFESVVSILLTDVDLPFKRETAFQKDSQVCSQQYTVSCPLCIDTTEGKLLLYLL